LLSAFYIISGEKEDVFMNNKFVSIKELKSISYKLILLTIILGVCALILLFSINEAGGKEVLKAIKKGGGGHLVSLDYNFYTPSGKEAGILSYNEIVLLNNRVSEIEDIALWTFNNIYSVKIGKREYPPEDASYSVVPIITGITPEFKKVMDVELKEGRFINKVDLIYKRRVCVVGGKIYDRLGGRKIIGKTLIAKEIIKDDGTREELKFTIIGVLHKKLSLIASLPDRVLHSTDLSLFSKSPDNIKDLQQYQSAFSRLIVNDGIYIPWTLWMDFFNKEEYSLTPSSLPPCFIYIKVKVPEDIGDFIKDEEPSKLVLQEECYSSHDTSFLYYLPEKIKEVCDKMRKVLKERRGKDKIFIFSYNGTFMDEIKVQLKEANKLLVIIVASALLFSGILLTSMMLMSVHKRVSEIGIRRAFGARKKDIFWQFLAEGVMIYSVGIIIGILVGLLVSYFVINKLLVWEFFVPIMGIVISSLFVFSVGILSSLYPAMRAANIPPAVAVKYE